MDLSDRDLAMTEASTPQAAILDDGTYIGVARGRQDTLDVIPGLPSPEFDPAQTPVVRLIPLGDTWQLQTGFRWTVDDEKLRRFAPQVLPRGELTGDRTVIRIAVVGTPHVTVEAIETSTADDRTILAETDSSGFPPYSAVISVQVGKPIALAMESALSGSTGRIVVAYHADVAPGIALNRSLVARAARLGITYTKQHNGLSVTARADLARLGSKSHFEER
ncbi:hypothetical protein [Rhodococcus koreensis]